MLPHAQRASRNPSAPLDNHEIAFGCGRIARRSSARRPLGFGAVLRHGWHGRAALRCGVSLRHRASASLPAHGIHPPIRRGALGRDTSRRVRARLGRRLPRTGGGLRFGSARRRPVSCALVARPLFLRRAFRAPYGSHDGPMEGRCTGFSLLLLARWWHGLFSCGARSARLTGAMTGRWEGDAQDSVFCCLHADCTATFLAARVPRALREQGQADGKVMHRIPSLSARTSLARLRKPSAIWRSVRGASRRLRSLRLTPPLHTSEVRSAGCVADAPLDHGPSLDPRQECAERRCGAHKWRRLRLPVSKVGLKRAQGSFIRHPLHGKGCMPRKPCQTKESTDAFCPSLLT